MEGLTSTWSAGLARWAALALIWPCWSGCSTLLGDPFDVISERSEANERDEAGVSDVDAGDAGSGQGLSVSFERTPEFAPFALAPLYSRTDPVSGEAVRATVRVHSEKRFDLARTPELRVEAEDRALEFAFDEERSDARTAVFQRTFEPGDRSGRYHLALSWSARGEDRATTSLEPGLELLDEPEPSQLGRVDTSADERGEPHTLLITRRWGAHTRSGHMLLGDSVRGLVRQISSTPEHCIAQVMVHEAEGDGDEVRPGRFIGVAQVAGVEAARCQPGEARFELFLEDAVEHGVFATPVTLSGHAGQAQPIVHGEWVATLPPGALGGTEPHVFAVLPHWPRTWHDDAGRSAPLPAAADALPYEAEWHRRAKTAERPALDPGSVAVYDPTRGRTLLVAGGERIWSWDGSTWSRDLAHPPVPGAVEIAAYDTARDRLVVVTRASADAGEPADSRTYEWDESDWQLQMPAHRPRAALEHAAYDSSRQRVIAMGKCGARPVEWDGVDWHDAGEIPVAGLCVKALVYDHTTRRTLAIGADATRTRMFALEGRAFRELESDTSPPVFAELAAAYDASRQRVVIYGREARGDAGELRGVDAWAWDGETWTRCERGDFPVRGRFLVFEAARDRLVLYGGGSELSELHRLTERGWESFIRPSAPPRRSRHAMAFDAGLQQMLIVGGMAATGAQRDTWEGSRGSWMERDVELPATPDSEGSTQVLFYDEARSASLLLRTGSSAGAAKARMSGPETLRYDGTGWTSLGVAPDIAPLTGFAGVYDVARQRAVVFGGRSMTSDEPLSTTWQVDGTSWSEVAVASAPPARFDHALAYDSARQRVVLFGGEARATGSAAANYLDDTWEWDGTSWVRLEPAVSPPPRSRHALAYDPRRGRVVLVGGIGPDGLALYDTWEWDGTAWSQPNPWNTPPSRAGHGLAFDPLTSRMVMFGGDNNGFVPTYYGDLWEWDGARWIERSTRLGPGSGALAYDAARERVVLHGGGDPSAGEEIGDETWEWDGDGWRLAGILEPSQAPLSLVAFDEQSGRVIMLRHMGEASTYETWGWDGTAWSRASADGPQFEPNYLAMYYDRTRSQLELLGREQVWRWFDGSWTATPTAAFPEDELDGWNFVRDHANGRTLVSGLSARSDVWSWRDEKWTAVDASPRGIACAAYDDVRRRSLFFHSISDSLFESASSTLEDEGFRPVPAHGRPNLNWCSAAFDAKRDQFVLVAETQTWLLRSSQPAHQLVVSLAPLLGTDRTREIVLDRLAVHAVTGADASQEQEPVRGAALDLWDGLRFAEVHRNEASSAEPRSLCFESARPATLNALEVGGKLAIVLRPTTLSTGRAPAQLHTQAIELRLRYHRGKTPSAAAQLEGPCPPNGWALADWEAPK